MKISKLLKSPVDKQKRIEVYQKALAFYKSEENLRIGGVTKISGLCIVLPILLWDLEHYLDPAPDGNIWYYEDTKKAFPEMKEVIEEMGTTYYEDKRRLRIQALENALKQLS